MGKLMEIIYDDTSHFGEPIVALRRLCCRHEVRYALRTLNGISMSMESESIEALMAAESKRVEQEKILQLKLAMKKKIRSAKFNSKRNCKRQSGCDRLLKRQW